MAEQVERADFSSADICSAKPPAVPEAAKRHRKPPEGRVLQEFHEPPPKSVTVRFNLSIGRRKLALDDMRAIGSARVVSPEMPQRSSQVLNLAEYRQSATLAWRAIWRLAGFVVAQELLRLDGIPSAHKPVNRTRGILRIGWRTPLREPFGKSSCIALHGLIPGSFMHHASVDTLESASIAWPIEHQDTGKINKVR